ncbi:Hsp20/alpha crystallin family protein [Aestuariibaculum sp. YM273]|uniref:Hsp20/alpha crystallin family protein n=1 Tax=Aestuariibaculum sp. YM273 TaxID=3070659 RepID=UPI0027DDD502|nr:Hsp20/alpha crystallin family protein [Aestuariibaculum sp. YM273]WMI65052.1 Hsp20/alpha crystallin family protein [Aestuariibaculum sp. YM273]
MSTLIPTTNRNGNKISDSNFNLLPNLTSWFDEILDHRFSTDFMSNFNTGISSPAVNIMNSENKYTIEMAVPGLKKSDFNIDIDNNVLSISAATETEHKEESEQYTRREFGYSSFKRTFTIPKTVDIERIKAEYNEGILNIHLPKMEKDKTKSIKKIDVS